MYMHTGNIPLREGIIAFTVYINSLDESNAGAIMGKEECLSNIQDIPGIERVIQDLHHVLEGLERIESILQRGPRRNVRNFGKIQI